MQKVKSNIHYPHRGNLLCIAQSSSISKPENSDLCIYLSDVSHEMSIYYVNSSVLNICLCEGNLHIFTACCTQNSVSKKGKKTPT